MSSLKYEKKIADSQFFKSSYEKSINFQYNSSLILLKFKVKFLLIIHHLTLLNLQGFMLQKKISNSPKKIVSWLRWNKFYWVHTDFQTNLKCNVSKIKGNKIRCPTFFKSISLPYCTFNWLDVFIANHVSLTLFDVKWLNNSVDDVLATIQ